MNHIPNRINPSVRGHDAVAGVLVPYHTHDGVVDLNQSSTVPIVLNYTKSSHDMNERTVYLTPLGRDHMSAHVIRV